MLRDDAMVLDISVQRRKHRPEKQVRHTSELSQIPICKSSVELTYLKLTLDVIPDRLGLSCWGALKFNLAKRQRKLAQSSNRGDTGFVEQQATTPVEHTAEETSEKTGEPSTSLQLERGVDADLTKVEPVLNGFSKIR